MGANIRWLTTALATLVASNASATPGQHGCALSNMATITYDAMARRFTSCRYPLLSAAVANTATVALVAPAELAHDERGEALPLRVTLDDLVLSTMAQPLTNRTVHTLTITSSAVAPAPGIYRGAVTLVIDAAGGH